MKYWCNFTNRRQKRYRLEINTKQGSGSVELGVYDPERPNQTPDIWLSADSVVITCETNDVWEHLIQHSASFTLLAKREQPQFFSSDYKDVQVSIFEMDEDWDKSGVVFYGFVNPQSYDQPYDGVYDSIEINCIDIISATQYMKYGGVKTSNYASYKRTANKKTFTQIMKNILDNTGFVADEAFGLGMYINCSYYVGSPTDRQSALSLSIDEQLFLGDNISDVKTCREVLDYIMKYLNMRLTMVDGRTLVAKSWGYYETVGTWQATDIFERCGSRTFSAKNVTINSSNIAGSSSISRGETYNQIKISCDQTSIDTVIEDPCKSDDMFSRYPKPVKYIDDLVVWMQGTTGSADKQFSELIVYGNMQGGSGESNDKEITSYYMQLMEHPQWTIKANVLNNYNKPQIDLAALKNGGSCFINVGDSLKKLDSYIMLKSPIGTVKYESKQSAGILTPSDNDTTNYLIISGSVIFTPKYDKMVTAWYEKVDDPSHASAFIYELIGRLNRVEAEPYAQDLLDTPSSTDPKLPKYVPINWNDSPRWKDSSNQYAFACPRFYTTDNGTTTDSASTVKNFMPPTDSTRRDMLVGANSMLTPGIPVLKCRLTIGDKVLKQTYTSTGCTYEWSNDASSTFYLFAGSKDIANEDEHKHIIGDWLEITNDVTDAMMIEGEGMLIPINKSDELNGQVKFEILDTNVLYWRKVTGQDYGELCSSSYTVGATNVSNEMEAVWIKDFEIKVVSDNGDVNNTSEKDLMYMSAEDESYENTKEVSMEINTALTTAERQSYGITDLVIINNPLDSNGVRVTSVYDAITKETAKPEEMYINSAYNRHHQSKLELKIDVLDNSEGARYQTNYTIPYISKSFYVTGTEYDITRGINTITLREK